MLKCVAFLEYIWCGSVFTFTTIPVGMCLRTTQLLVLLVAWPPGPDPRTNCSSSSSSFRTGRSVRSFLPAARTRVSPDGVGLNNGERPGAALHTTCVHTLSTRRVQRTSSDITLLIITNKSLNVYFSWCFICPSSASPPPRGHVFFYLCTSDFRKLSSNQQACLFFSWLRNETCWLSSAISCFKCNT